MRQAIVAIGIVTALALGIWSLGKSSPIYHALNSKESVTIDGQVFAVEVASTQTEQAKGLSGRQSLAEGTGMLFTFKPPQQPSFWMKDMYFPLDIVWINNGKIIDVSRDVPAPDYGTPTADLPLYAPSGPVDNVLEINAGDSSKFKIGDSVIFNKNSSL